MSSYSCRLDSLLEITSSKRIHMADYVPSGIPFYRGKEVIERAKGNTVSTELFITEAQYQEIKRKFGSPQDGDILLTSVGTLGVAYFVDGDGDFYFKDGNVTWFRNFDPKVVPKYLYYWLTSPETQKRLDEVSIGSTQRALTISALKSLQVELPSVDSQKAIVDMLDAVTNRITLLRETNATLEAIAQALFKSWFVDFDPVRAKMEGRTPDGMDEATAALFPDGLETSELGEVPRGWRYSTAGESFVLTMGQSPPGDTYNESGEGLAFYQGRTDFGFRFPTQRVYCSAPTRYAEPGDTLVSVRAPVGDVNMALERCCIGRGVASVRHPSGFRGFAFYAMRGLGERFKTFDSEGTVFGSISKKDFHNLPVVIAPEAVLRAYDEVTSPIDQRIVENEVMLRTVTTLRDTLLPRLISGQLRLPEARAPLEGAL